MEDSSIFLIFAKLMVWSNHMFLMESRERGLVQMGKLRV